MFLKQLIGLIVTFFFSEQTGDNSHDMLNPQYLVIFSFNLIFI